MRPKKTLVQSQKQPNVPMKSQHSRGRFLASFFTFALLVAAVALFYNRQAILDDITAWRFTPSAELVTLEDNAGLNQTGKFYLSASQAEISDKAAFNTACGKLQNERTVVIGCYTGADKRIYIYNVTDAQLDGVKETTTAHEMLHAAYDRLSASDRTYVDGLLTAEKAKITDTRILSLIKEYEKSEPDEVVNELHSIFGTEVRDLSPELETYYARYFSDRLKVVALKEKYEKVFTDLASKQTALVAELNTLATDVNTRQKAYEASLDALNTDIESFNVWAESGTAKKSDYATRRAALQERITALDTERDAINTEIDDYNAKKAELDTLNVQAATLNQSIDSKLSTSTPTL